MLKQIVASLLLCAAPVAVAAAKEKAPKTLPGGWVYEWGDEFNGTKLNEKKWAYELGVVRNHGASQAYTKDCVKVRNGKLLLISKAKETPNCVYKENGQNWMQKIKTQPFASGSVTTRNVKHFELPGRLEFRAKIPHAKGVWPAIWTMHVNKYGWPANGEIDILEHISQEPQTCYSIFRWGKNGGNEEHKVVRTKKFTDYSKDFHTYVLEWDENAMRILIDNDEVGRIKMSDADYPNGDNPLKTPCYLIINTAIGGQGTWPEKADPKDYPVQFEIDYVRYYTKKSSSTSSDEAAPKKSAKKKKRAKREE